MIFFGLIFDTDPTGQPSPLSGVRAIDQGPFVFHWTPAVNGPPGNWTLKVTEWASGKTATGNVLLER